MTIDKGDFQVGTSWIRFTETGKIEDYLNYCREEKETERTGYRGEGMLAGGLDSGDAKENGYKYHSSRHGAAGASYRGI